MTIPTITDFSPASLKRIGKTPILRFPGEAGEIFSKCENYNPTGSHKDRAYLHMIENMAKAGKVREGDVLVDYTTGNGGVSLAFVARCMGFESIAVMPEGITVEREEQIRGLGAELILTPREQYVKGARETAEKIVKNNPETHRLINQSDNLDNSMAFEEAGREISGYFKSVDRTIGAFVCGIGTGGTFSGIAKVLKDDWPDIITVGVEVVDSAPIFAKRKGIPFRHNDHRLVGFGAGAIAMNTAQGLIDHVETVSYEESLKEAMNIAVRDCHLVGPSSGANMLMAKKWRKILKGGTDVVTVFFDAGYKYGNIYRTTWESSR